MKRPCNECCNDNRVREEQIQKGLTADQPVENPTPVDNFGNGGAK